MDIKAQLVGYQKAFEACDTETAQKILEENVRLKNESELLIKKVEEKEEVVVLLNELIIAMASTEMSRGSQQEARPVVVEETVLPDEDVVLHQENGVEEHNEHDNVAHLQIMKNSGHVRESPQTESTRKTNRSHEPIQPLKFKCAVCKLERDSKEKLERHMKNHIEDGDWTCDGCAYQCSDQNDLLNHLLEKRDHSTILLDHLLNKNVYDRRDKCNLCGEMFESKTSLHSHLLSSHKSYKPCNKMPNCSGEECRFNHDEITEGVHLCYQCGNEFSSRSELMDHMRQEHTMPACKHYLMGKCTFHEQCWYSHENKSPGASNPVQQNIATPQTNSGFWNPVTSKAPPLQNMNNQQQMIERMMQMNQQMMKDMMTQMTKEMMKMTVQMAMYLLQVIHQLVPSIQFVSTLQTEIKIFLRM